jgi:hypothetical protein
VSGTRGSHGGKGGIKLRERLNEYRKAKVFAGLIKKALPTSI